MTETSRGRIALVTGAARGLGRAMCIGLARAGYNVAALDLRESEAELETFTQEVGPQSAVVFPVYCDVTKFEECRDAVDAVYQRFGAIDILVNNAAIGMEVVTPTIHANPFKFYEIEESFWRRVVDINLLGTFRMTKLVVPQQVERGWGRIINVTTSLTTMVKPGFSPYGPSKAGIEAASSIWSKELAGTGVTVNVLVPGGPADTRMIPPEDEGDRTRLVRPSAMVAPLLWLASPAADQVTGRRYQAKLWPAELPGEEAENLAGAGVAWG
jgi:NAD(P)-dependent dehydrogenase (short-subunit alcohol dehydrogenase family)